MFYKDPYGKTHDNVKDWQDANDRYDQETRNLHSTNMTRPDLFIGAVLMIASLITLLVIKGVYESGEGWLFLLGYIASLAAGWTLWVYALRIPLQYRPFVYLGIFFIGLAIGFYFDVT